MNIKLKKALYESIMKSVSKLVKKALLEAENPVKSGEEIYEYLLEAGYVDDEGIIDYDELINAADNGNNESALNYLAKCLFDNNNFDFESNGADVEMSYYASADSIIGSNSTPDEIMLASADAYGVSLEIEATAGHSKHNYQKGRGFIDRDSEYEYDTNEYEINDANITKVTLNGKFEISDTSLLEHIRLAFPLEVFDEYCEELADSYANWEGDE